MRNRILTVLGVLLLVGLVLNFLGVKMAPADLHISAAAEPLGCIGGTYEGGHCSEGTLIPITNSLVMTVIVDLLLVLAIFAGARNMSLIPRGFQNALEAVIEGFYNFALGIDRKNINKFFVLPATIFLFFLVANLTALIPGVGSIGSCVTEGSKEATASIATTVDARSVAAAEEGAEGNAFFANWPGACSGGGKVIVPWLRAPGADLNVTFAFALVAMFMVQYFGFQALGLTYLTKFFNFKEGFLGLFVGLIEIISEVSRIISFAFRMFGNIFGGEVILVVMSYLFAYILPLPFYGFEVFVAIIQALIFAVLTLIFFSTAVIAHGGHEDEHGHHEGGVQVESDVAPVHA